MLTCGGLIRAAAQFPGSPPPVISTRRRPAPLSTFPARTHWTLALNSQLTAAPAYDGSVGYFPVEDDRILSYDLITGRARWTATGTPRTALAVGGGLLFVDQAGKLTALRTADGSTAWTIPFGETLVTPLVWENGLLVAATATELLAARAEDGMLVWRQPIAGAHASPAITADRVYVPLGDNRVMALRRDTGATIWEHKLGGAPNEILALDDRIFVGANDNFLYALATADGAIDWRWQTGADVLTRPAFDADRIYFVSLDNVLRAVNRKNGVQQWKKALPFRPVWAPVKAADILLVTGLTGQPRGFFMKDGAPGGELTSDPAPFLPVPAAPPLPLDALHELLSFGPPLRAALDPMNSEIVAPLYTFSTGHTLGPVVVIVRRWIAAGAVVSAFSRQIEPFPVPMAPLPASGIAPPATLGPPRPAL